MSAHTPGPWRWEFNSASSEDTHCIEVVAEGRVNSVAYLQSYVSSGEAYDDRAQTVADARLIAAAPDSHAANVAMVDALNVAFGITSEHDDEFIYDTLPTSAVASAYFAARAAVEKATQP